MGNGRNIRVLEDNWVPNSSTHKVIYPKGMFPLDSKVCDFIDVEKRCWDSDSGEATCTKIFNFFII